MMDKKVIELNMGGGLYTCQYDWPDCKIQAGGNGVVFKNRSIQDVFQKPVDALKVIVDGQGVEENESVYRTAYFEVFPREPNTFIRGEGKSVQAAEAAAWDKYQSQIQCDHPEFEKRDYKNGAGFCVACGMFSPSHYPPWSKCKGCDYLVYPSDEYCHHCTLVVVDEVEEKEYLSDWINARKRAARLFVEQPYFCPYCKTAVKDMRLVSAVDHRLTDEEKGRQWQAQGLAIAESYKVAGLSESDRNILTFPTSVFFECGCEELRLIVDLDSGGNDE